MHGGGKLHAGLSPDFGEPGTTVSPAADLNTAEAALIGYAVAARDAPRTAAVGVGGGSLPERLVLLGAGSDRSARGTGW